MSSFGFFIHSGFLLCFIHRAHWGCHIGLWSRNILEPICIQMYSDFAAKRQNSTYFRDLERQALAAILPSITFNFLNVAAQNTFVLESGTIWCFSTIFLPFNKTGSGVQVIEQTWNYSSTLIRETMRLLEYLYTSNMSLKPFQFLHLIENKDLFESLSKNFWIIWWWVFSIRWLVFSIWLFVFRICSPVKEILGHLIVVGEELVTKLLHLILRARAHLLLKMIKKW